MRSLIPDTSPLQTNTKHPIVSKMYQLEIFRDDEHRVTSLIFSRLPAKWRHVESKEVMPAVISAVQTHAINTAVPRSNFFSLSVANG